MQNLTLYYDKDNDKWCSQPPERYDIKIDLEKIEKEGTRNFSLWKDKKNNEFWICKKTDSNSERWVQYKGDIKEILKLSEIDLVTELIRIFNDDTIKLPTRKGGSIEIK